MKKLCAGILLVLSFELCAYEPKEYDFVRFKLGAASFRDQSTELTGFSGGKVAFEYSRVLNSYESKWFESYLEFSVSPLHHVDLNDRRRFNVSSYTAGVSFSYNFWKRSVLRVRAGGGLTTLDQTDISHTDLGVSKAMLTKGGHEFSINLNAKLLVTHYEDQMHLTSVDLSYGYNF